jgi:hypothetical protein
MSSSETEREGRAPVAAWCDDHSLHVRLTDGREISTPLWWYPSLLGASHAQRNTFELMYTGMHWRKFDEDLSMEGMLRGWKARDARSPTVAAE